MIHALAAAVKSINIAVVRMRNAKDKTKPKPSALSF